MLTFKLFVYLIAVVCMCDYNIFADAGSSKRGIFCIFCAFSFVPQCLFISSLNFYIFRLYNRFVVCVCCTRVCSLRLTFFSKEFFFFLTGILPIVHSDLTIV